MAYFKVGKYNVTFEGNISGSLLNPIFNEINSHSWKIIFSYTEISSLVFGRPELINAVDATERKYDAYFISKIFIMKGELTIDAFKNNKYEGFFIGQNAFNNLAAEEKITNLDLGEINTPDDLFGPGHTDDYTYQINNEDAYCFCNMWNYSFNESFNFNLDGFKSINSFVAASHATDSRVIPFFNIHYIIEKILKHFGFIVIENKFKKLDQFKKLYLWNNYTIDKIYFEDSVTTVNINNITVSDNEVIITTSSAHGLSDNDFISIVELTEPNSYSIEGQVFQVKVEDITSFTLENINVEDFEFLNGTSSGKVLYMSLESEMSDIIRIQNHLPHITFRDLKDAMEGLGMYIFPDESKKEVRIYSLKQILLDNNPVDITEYASIIKGSDLIETDGYEIVYDLSNGDEYFTEQVKELNDNHILKSQVAHLNSLPSTNNENNDVRLVADIQAYYKYSKSAIGARFTRQFPDQGEITVGNWKFYSQNFLKMISDGDNKLPIELKFLPILKYWSQALNHYILKCDEEGNSAGIGNENTEAIRLFFVDEVIDSVRLMGDFENDYMSFRIDGTKGIYNTCLKEIIDWKLTRGKEAQSQIYWPVHILKSFKFWKKYRIKNTNYLISEIPFSISHNDQVSFGKTKLIRV